MTELEYHNGVYHTSPQAASFPAKIMPSLAFYLRLMMTVYRDSVLGKKGLYDTPTWSKSSAGILEIAEKVGIQVEVSGIENVRSLSTPAVFIGNHMSMLETLLLPSILCPIRRMTYILKQDLLEYPIFKHVLQAIEVVAVSRTNPRQDLKTVLREGTARLNNGLSVMVFPQTTRSHTFDPTQMSSLGVKLAKKAAMPIIPLALKTDALQNGTLIKDLGRIDTSRPVHFAFGEPLEVVGKGNAEHEAVLCFISDKLAHWQIS